MPTDDEREALLGRVNQAVIGMVPFNRRLGLRAVEFGDGVGAMLLPWSEDLIGNPDLGILHGGAITALVDATCGMAVFARLMQPVPIATLDLRIDYLRPSAAGRDVVARAECYRLTRNVAFVRALAYQGEPDDPIAAAAGTFMIATPGRSAMERARTFDPDPSAGDGGGAEQT
jgi:uncharacterized protein (TIGR00369 family)